jgi:acetyl-CoA carboxylase biotin carboxyl carrier protein
VAKADLELDRIRELIAVMRETGVTELSVELPDLKISLKRDAAEAGALSLAPPVTAAEAAASEGLYAVTAPMVGIFRATAGLDAKVSPGDTVSAGQVIGAIEAMKVPNSVPSPVAGVVREVLAADGAAVEYGQPLLLIEPQPAREGVESEAEAI